MEKTTYRTVSEKMQHTDLGNYVTFGIQAVTETGQMEVIHDISTYQDYVENLTALFNRNELDLVHFQEVMDDFLGV